MTDIDPIEEFEHAYEWSSRLYRAIGRFVVRFEWLCDQMRDTICQQVWQDPTSHTTLVKTVLGDVQPAGLLIRLQSVLRQLAWVDPSDRPIIDNICRRIGRLIEERNRVVHGLWITDVQLPDGSAIGTKLRHAPSGMKQVHWQRSPEDIERLADEAEYVARLVIQIGWAEAEGPMSSWLALDEDGNVRFLPGGDG